MGMNLCGIFVRKYGQSFESVVKCLKQLRLINDKQSIDIDNILDFDALGDGAILCGENKGWYLVFGDSNRFFEIELSEALTELSESGEVFLFLIQSVTGGLWFEYYVSGEQKRQWIEIEREVVSHQGEPLQAEPEGLFTSDPDEEYERDDWKVIGLAEAITGISWDEMSMPGKCFK